MPLSSARPTILTGTLPRIQLIVIVGAAAEVASARTAAAGVVVVGVVVAADVRPCTDILFKGAFHSFRVGFW